MEAILNFNIDIDVNLLDKMIENQNDTKVSAVLNQFVNHPLAWTKINSILTRSSNEKSQYFALSILEQVIRKEWKSLQPDQRHPVLNQLLTIVRFIPTNQPQQQSSNLVRKKSNSLIAQCLMHEYPNWNQFIAIIIEAASRQECIESVIQIFKELALFYKRHLNVSSLTPAQIQSQHSLFNDTFQRCKLVVQSTSSSQQLVSEAMVAMKEQMELVDRVTLLGSFQLIIERMIATPTHRGTCILLLIELVQVIGNNYLNNNNSSSASDINRDLLVIFENIVRSLLRFIPNTFKEINQFFLNNGILCNNIVILLTSLFKSFHSVVLSAFESQKEVIAIANRQIILLGWINETAVSQLCLEYWKFMFDKVRELQSESFFNFFSESIPLIARVIYKILKKQDQELIESRESGSECGILYKNTNDSSDEEWLLFSKYSYEALHSISTLYPSALKFYIDKLLKLTSVPDNFSPSKYNSICWSIGVCIEELQNYSDIDNLLSHLFKLKEKVDKEYSNQLSISILYIIRHAHQYLQCKDVSVEQMLMLVSVLISDSKVQTVSEMACITLLSMIEKRSYQFILNFPSYHLNINNMLPSVSKPNKIILYECIGTYLRLYQEIVTQSQGKYSQPNFTISPILDQLNSMLQNKKLEIDGLVEWSLNINTFLQYNSALAKSLHQLYSIQFNNINQHLLELYNWTNQANDNISIQNQQVTIKKNILELIESYIPYMTAEEFNHILIPFLSVILKDNRINQASQSQIPPKGLQFLNSLCEHQGSLLASRPDVTIYVLKYFMLPAFNSSNTSYSGKLYQLMDSISKSKVLFTIDEELFSNYFNLIEKSIQNTSSDVHRSAIESVMNYYASASLHQYTPGAKTLNPQPGSSQLIFSVPLKNRILKALMLTLLNPEYNTSIDLISQCIQSLLARSRGDGIEVTSAIKGLPADLHQLFRKLAYESNPENFESTIRNFLSTK